VVRSVKRQGKDIIDEWTKGSDTHLKQSLTKEAVDLKREIERA
jgi:hypothetical protein